MAVLFLCVCARGCMTVSSPRVASVACVRVRVRVAAATQAQAEAKDTLPAASAECNKKLCEGFEREVKECAERIKHGHGDCEGQAREWYKCVDHCVRCARRRCWGGARGGGGGGAH
jgi:hypothetical protein